ncbi:MAG TPA: STM4015 family protein [Verrucomicrobiae bacterium]
MISEHVSEWLGFPVKEYREEDSQKNIQVSGDTIYRLTLDYDAEGTFEELLANFLKNPGVEQLHGIIIGQFFGDDPSGASAQAVQALAAASSQLPNLRAIFLGEMISEECEISWINHDNVFPLLAAYPGLEHLRIRGGSGLRLGRGARHQKLKSLTIETGGLDRVIFNEAINGDFPVLEHLELWLGSDNYGGSVTIADLRPLLSGQLFPRLRYLGLRDAEDIDEIAAVIGSAPILDRILTLDLSLGNLSDEGGRALLGSDRLKRLRTLDLHHHYLSDEVMDELKAEYPNADLSDQKQSDEDGDETYRYIAVSE